MKKALLAAAALVALPVDGPGADAAPGFYIGAEGGVNWLLNFNANTNIPACADGWRDARSRAGWPVA